MSSQTVERQRQLEFVRSNAELRYGSTDTLSLSAGELLRTDSSSPWFVAYLSSGLTNHIYKIVDRGRFYALKLRRNPILVSNIDGQVSFLNEVERRIEIENLRQETPFDWSFAVETIYADHQRGVILSPWIEGRALEYNALEVGAALDALVTLAANGFFDWDPCRGNYIWDGSRIHMFDYGYTYRFDPVNELNSNGPAPSVFNVIERFETRCFFGHLLHLLADSGLDNALALYALEKQAALQAVTRLISLLVARLAVPSVVSYYEEVARCCRHALMDRNELDRLFRLEAFRSWRLDVDDDLSGETCNSVTLSKARMLVSFAAEGYEFLKAHNGLFFGEERMTQQQLVAEYTDRLTRVRTLLDAAAGQRSQRREAR